MKPVSRMVLCLLSALSLPVAADPMPTAGLNWIAGHWCLDEADGRTEEVWLPPTGAVAIGLSRTTRGERTVAFEYLRVMPIDGVPAYVAQPGGRPPTVFKQVDSGPGWARFENRQHDFPQRIEYRREGETLTAEIAGPGEGGKEQRITYAFTACEAH